MAEYYIAPKSSFDATADAIREKTGSQATIEWTEDGFADAIEEIPSGGGLEDYINGVPNTVISSNNVTTVQKSALRAYENSFSISFPNCTEIHEDAFRQAHITTAYLPNLTTLVGRNQFRESTLSYAIFPKLSNIGGGDTFEAANGTKNLLLGADLGAKSLVNSITIPQWAFYLCTAVVIILRYPQLCPLGNINAFANSRYGSGGTGGTIYIPKALYDHLGDGTSLDYRAATNWSTIEGYGTITWAKIESSQYENYYADGTPIPTE